MRLDFEMFKAKEQVSSDKKERVQRYEENKETLSSEEILQILKNNEVEEKKEVGRGGEVTPNG